MEDAAPMPNRRENLRRSIMARRQARGRLSPVKVEQNWNRRSETAQADLEKKERRREQNRRAAQRCRTKKRLTQYNVIKSLEKIVEHNRTLQKEVQQLRWDKCELRRKWAAHKKLCPCLKDQQQLDNFESNMAIKTEPISDEEEEISTDMKKLLDSEGQENEMEFSFASIASVLCSSPIAGFPKNFPEIANISDISDESLSASLCSEMISCSPSSLGVMDSHFLPSPIKLQKDDKVAPSSINKSHVTSSQNSPSIPSSQTSIGSLSTRSSANINTSASNNIPSSSCNNNSNNINNEIRYNVAAPPGWHQSAKASNHSPQNHSTFSPQSSCMYSGTIPDIQEFTFQQQQMQIPQHLYSSPHQAYPAHQGISMGHSYHQTQYSENHSTSGMFQTSTTFSMPTPSSNIASCSSPNRHRCSATSGAQKPKSVQYPGLCRLLQPQPSPAQVVPSLPTSSGDITGGSNPSSTLSGNPIPCIPGLSSNVTSTPASHQPNFLCNRPRSVLASGESTPDTLMGSTRDGYRGRCSSESSDASGHKVPSSASETFFPRRSSETPETENDDVFSSATIAQANPTSANLNFDTNNNSALVSDNNVHNSDGNRASTSDVMLFSHEGGADTSSVLEGVRHLIDNSGYSNGISSCSNTPNSISSNSSMHSEVDDLLFEIPSDALLFFEAHSEVDTPQSVFSNSL